MALKKKIEYQNGTSAEYHNISSISIYPFDLIQEAVIEQYEGYPEQTHILEELLPQLPLERYKLIIKVNSYVNESIRRQHPEAHLESYTFDHDINRIDLKDVDVYVYVYNFLKTQEKFKDAENA